MQIVLQYLMVGAQNEYQTYSRSVDGTLVADDHNNPPININALKG